MKKHHSKRNRHTGRINAAKYHVLEKGQPAEASDGTRYMRLITGHVGGAAGSQPVAKCTMVRVPPVDVSDIPEDAA